MLTRSGARLLPLLLPLAACSPAARPAPATPARAPAPIPTAAPAAPAPDAPPSAAEEETPLPEAPPPPPVSAWSKAAPGQTRTRARFGDGDKTEVVRALCEGKPALLGKHGFQCACPSYADMPEGSLRMDVGPFFPGHFTGPGRDDVVVVLRGCDSGAGSSQTYASHAVVRREPEGWKLALFERGALGDCTSVLSPSGRSRLVCHRSGGHMGAYWGAIDLVAFDETAGQVEPQAQVILGYAWSEGGEAPSDVIDVTRFAVLGKPAYEAGDERALSIDVGIRRRVRCGEDRKACAALADKATIDLSLRYTFDGATFQLTPASRPAYERLWPRDRE